MLERIKSVRLALLMGLLMLFASDFPLRADEEPIKISGSAKVGGHVHPSICRTKDGTLIVVFKSGQSLVCVRSTDGGKTWEQPEPIATSAKRPDAIREVKIFEVYPGSLDTLPDDRVLVTWNYIADDKAKDGYYERACSTPSAPIRARPGPNRN